jgi:methylated-DNA-[protein]-cysteine S-methyltransferase
MPDHTAIRTSIPGPWGPFHLAATGFGVVAVAWQTTEAAFETDLVRRLGARIERSDDADVDDPRRVHLVAAVAGLEALLGGRAAPRGLRFDLADRPAWDRAVLAAVAAVPWGTTVSYGDIARRVGSPRAARAVGGAVGRNPIGLLIPCHRVIAADGTIGGYGGDGWGSREDRLAIKGELLRREGITVAVAAR